MAQARVAASEEQVRIGSRAYRYVIQKLGGMPWDPPLDSPAAIADWLEIPEQSLDALQAGDLSQIPSIKEAFQELFRGSLHEAEIESFLPTQRQVAL
jgi:hypothetical protein